MIFLWILLFHLFKRWQVICYSPQYTMHILIFKILLNKKSSRRIWHINPILLGEAYWGRSKNTGHPQGWPGGFTLGTTFTWASNLISLGLSFPMCRIIIKIFPSRGLLPLPLPHLLPSPSHHFQLCQVPRGRTSHHFLNYFKYIYRV